MYSSFLGSSPNWFKNIILAFLVLSYPIMLAIGGHPGSMVVGWAFIAGLCVVVAVELTKTFGFGGELEPHVRAILKGYIEEENSIRTSKETYALIVQGVCAILLIFGLAFHVMEVGLIGLMLLVLVTAMTGIVEEKRIGHAFEESLPFVSLLVIFFVIVGMIHDLHLFSPVVEWVLALPVEQQPKAFFLANGILSAISDNVFVATVYINEVRAAFDAGKFSREHFDALAVAINTGTNLPSVATPNGQAAFILVNFSVSACYPPRVHEDGDDGLAIYDCINDCWLSFPIK